MKNLFVGNMSFATPESELLSNFEPSGEITQVNAITDRDTGPPRGFAFVEMTNDEDAANAITAMNGKEMEGRALNVNEARPWLTEATDHSSESGSVAASRSRLSYP